ncbi:MAG: DUF1828 domain-containing protein [Ignavibacteriales bacterium]|nr:DUF1828 domain-containing protein [Ignavibacteriales bacterium]
MKCEILLDSYLRAVANNSEIRRIQDNCVLITPYLHSHGVYISVFANESDNKIKVHDNGETLQSLFLRGVKIVDNSHREELLKDICRTYNVEVNGWTIQKIIEVDYLGEAIIDLINAVKSANDLIYLHQASSSNVFRFEVEMFLKGKNLSYTPNKKINGRTTEHRIDFHYKKEKDNFINVISGSDLQTKVIKSGFSYYDIKENHTNFAWISVLNPEDKWTAHSLEILNQFSQTVTWQNKDSLINLLN